MRPELEDDEFFDCHGPLESALWQSMHKAEQAEESRIPGRGHNISRPKSHLRLRIDAAEGELRLYLNDRDLLEQRGPTITVLWSRLFAACGPVGSGVVSTNFSLGNLKVLEEGNTTHSSQRTRTLLHTLSPAFPINDLRSSYTPPPPLEGCIEIRKPEARSHRLAGQTKQRDGRAGQSEGVSVSVQLKLEEIVSEVDTNSLRKWMGIYVVGEENGERRAGTGAQRSCRRKAGGGYRVQIEVSRIALQLLLDQSVVEGRGFRLLRRAWEGDEAERGRWCRLEDGGDKAFGSLEVVLGGAEGKVRIEHAEDGTWSVQMGEAEVGLLLTARLLTWDTPMYGKMTMPTASDGVPQRMETLSSSMTALRSVTATEHGQRGPQISSAMYRLPLARVCRVGDRGAYIGVCTLQMCAEYAARLRGTSGPRMRDWEAEEEEDEEGKGDLLISNRARELVIAEGPVLHMHLADFAFDLTAIERLLISDILDSLGGQGNRNVQGDEERGQGGLSTIVSLDRGTGILEDSAGGDLEGARYRVEVEHLCCYMGEGEGRRVRIVCHELRVCEAIRSEKKRQSCFIDREYGWQGWDTMLYGIGLTEGAQGGECALCLDVMREGDNVSSVFLDLFDASVRYRIESRWLLRLVSIVAGMKSSVQRWEEVGEDGDEQETLPVADEERLVEAEGPRDEADEEVGKADDSIAGGSVLRLFVTVFDGVVEYGQEEGGEEGAAVISFGLARVSSNLVEGAAVQAYKVMLRDLMLYVGTQGRHECLWNGRQETGGLWQGLETEGFVQLATLNFVDASIKHRTEEVIESSSVAQEAGHGDIMNVQQGSALVADVTVGLVLVYTCADSLLLLQEMISGFWEKVQRENGRVEVVGNSREQSTQKGLVGGHEDVESQQQLQREEPGLGQGEFMTRHRGGGKSYMDDIDDEMFVPVVGGADGEVQTDIAESHKTCKGLNGMLIDDFYEMGKGKERQGLFGGIDNEEDQEGKDWWAGWLGREVEGAVMEEGFLVEVEEEGVEAAGEETRDRVSGLDAEGSEGKKEGGEALMDDAGEAALLWHPQEKEVEMDPLGVWGEGLQRHRNGEVPAGGDEAEELLVNGFLAGAGSQQGGEGRLTLSLDRQGDGDHGTQGIVEVEGLAAMAASAATVGRAPDMKGRREREENVESLLQVPVEDIDQNIRSSVGSSLKHNYDQGHIRDGEGASQDGILTRAGEIAGDDNAWAWQNGVDGLEHQSRWFVDGVRVYPHHVSQAKKEGDNSQEEAGVGMRVVLHDMSLRWRMFAGRDFGEEWRQEKEQHREIREVVSEGLRMIVGDDDGPEWLRGQQRRGKKKDRKGRKVDCMVEICLSHLSAKLDSYIPGQSKSSSLLLRVLDFHVLDRINTAQPRRILGYWRSDTEHPRDSKQHMLHLDLTSHLPTYDTTFATPTYPSDVPPEELTLRLRLLPLRCYIDQHTIHFLLSYFQLSTSLARPLRLSPPALPTPPTFFTLALIRKVKVKLDTRTRPLDVREVQKRNPVELLNLCPLKGVRLELQAVCLRGMSGWDAVFAGVRDSWIRDVTQKQIHRILMGPSAIRSVFNVGSGVADLVLIPIRQYRKDGRIMRGLKKGMSHCLKNVTIEALNASVGLTRAMAMTLNDLVTDVPRLPQPDLQPQGVRDSLEHAYDSLSRGLHAAAHTIIAIPIQELERTGPRGSVRAVFRALPIAVVRPVAGASEAISVTLLGLRNRLDPAARKEEEELWRV